MADYLRENWLEVLGTIVGLVYLYQEFKASINLWITGIIMPAIYIFVYYDAGLYADFGIQIYYLLAAAYGYAVWKWGGKKDKAELPITRMPLRVWIASACLLVASFVVIRTILVEFTNSTVPDWDAFTTATSIVGLWILARKHVEQWLIWIAVDAVSTGLYVYKGIYATAVLYGLYTVIAVWGYYHWNSLRAEV